MRRSIAALALSAGLLFTTAGVALAAPPGNDDIASPRIVGALPYTDGPYDTTEATSGATDPECFFLPPDRSTVWYSFTPTVSGPYGANTYGSDYDTTLYVGTPNGSGGIDIIACNNDVIGSPQSAIRWEAVAGTTYLLAVGTCCGGGVVGEAGGGGTLVFNVDVASPPPTIDVTIDPLGYFNRTGAATISGTVTCTGDIAISFIEVELTRAVGHFSITGWGEVEGFVCDGTTQSWSLDLLPSNGKFKGGHAVAAAFAAACDAESRCDEDFEQTTVRLRK
jgi:hypothetical protein